MKKEELITKLKERLRRLTEDFKDYPEIQAHGVPEIVWVLKDVGNLE